MTDEECETCAKVYGSSKIADPWMYVAQMAEAHHILIARLRAEKEAVERKLAEAELASTMKLHHCRYENSGAVAYEYTWLLCTGPKSTATPSRAEP